MVEHLKYQSISIIASILTIVAFSYLVIRVHKTKKTEHLTFVWLSIILSAQILLFIYGYLNSFRVIYLQATVILIGLIYILYIKLNAINGTINEIINGTNEETNIESELKVKKIII